MLQKILQHDSWQFSYLHNHVFVIYYHFYMLNVLMMVRGCIIVLKRIITLSGSCEAFLFSNSSKNRNFLSRKIHKKVIPGGNYKRYHTGMYRTSLRHNFFCQFLSLPEEPPNRNSLSKCIKKLFQAQWVWGGVKNLIKCTVERKLCSVIFVKSPTREITLLNITMITKLNALVGRRATIQSNKIMPV